MIVQLKHEKAKQLLKSLEDLDLIRLVDDEVFILQNSPSNITDSRNQIHAPMTEEQIDMQLKQLRDEWDRDF